MIFVRDVVSAIEELIPISAAAAWDNVGLVIGDRDAPCTRALLTIDLSLDVIDEARERDATFVLAYHPPILKPTKQFHARDLAYEAARAGLSVYSPHTAFDAVDFGTTASVANALSFTDVGVVLASSARVHRCSEEDSFVGFVARVKRGLAIDHVIVSAPTDHRVSRVCLCAGAGGSFVDAAAVAGADTLVAGELSHHDVLRARRLGMAVICTFHTNTERLALAPLSDRLRALISTVDFVVSTADRDPFSVM